MVAVADGAAKLLVHRETLADLRRRDADGRSVNLATGPPHAPDAELPHAQTPDAEPTDADQEAHR